jgi:hypothetical protein
MIRKRCSLCGKARGVIHFWKDSRKSDGLQSACMECERIRRAAEPTKYRWPLVAEAQLHPPRDGGRDGEDNLCMWCPGLVECRTRVCWGMPCLCERADSRAAAREPRLEADKAQDL